MSKCKLRIYSINALIQQIGHRPSSL